MKLSSDQATRYARHVLLAELPLAQLLVAPVVHHLEGAQPVREQLLLERRLLARLQREAVGERGAEELLHRVVAVGRVP